MARMLTPYALLAAAAALGGCKGTTAAEPGLTFVGSIELVSEGPLISNTLGSVLVRHVSPDLNNGELSVVHIQEQTRIYRASGGEEDTLRFQDLAAGITAHFRTTGYEVRTNPRQVIATQVQVTRLSGDLD